MFGWWRKKMRKIDEVTLWPALKRQARNVQHARDAFFVHCSNDKNWTTDFTLSQIAAYIADMA